MKKSLLFIITIVSTLGATETIAQKRARLAAERAQVVADAEDHRRFVEGQQRSLDAFTHVGRDHLDVQIAEKQDNVARIQAQMQLTHNSIQNLDQAVDLVRQSAEYKDHAEELTARMDDLNRAFQAVQQLLNSMPAYAQQVQQQFQ